MLENAEGAINNEQSRETGNIGYTRHRTKTNKQKTQHRDTVNIGYTRLRTKINKQTKTQYRDTVNIGYTRHRTKTNKQKTQHRKLQKMSNMDPYLNTHEGLAVSASYKTPVLCFII